MTRPRIAFFDVDGTVTTDTTLFRFLRHYLAACGHDPSVYEQRRRSLRTMTDRGVPRERTNQVYFENFKDADAADVSRLAQEWFAAEVENGGFFNGHTLAALRRHQGDRDRVVLVSGSFPACLDPVAAYLGSDETWCTPPEIHDGRYTGRLIGPPMIGAAKAQAVRTASEGYGVPLDRCVAYGDHSSDLPMLRATGTAVVVGGDLTMRAQARARSWGLLPGAPAPDVLPLPVREN
ncbi:HAD superfamily hydrolase (TIGR01490 family) [Streptomyces sp. 846.5]|nr:HAD-IB family hydrolase [Streptomyces sp. 846.5]TDU04077.1 HAD superfamily hydrolase (TIGR01490 family) [Streptomyces sp. 846.5]